MLEIFQCLLLSMPECSVQGYVAPSAIFFNLAESRDHECDIRIAQNSD